MNPSNELTRATGQLIEGLSNLNFNSIVSGDIKKKKNKQYELEREIAKMHKHNEDKKPKQTENNFFVKSKLEKRKSLRP